MDYKTEIEAFFVSENIGVSDRKKAKPRLPVSIDFMTNLGVGISDTPTQADYDKLEEYLRTLIIPKGRNKGKPYGNDTIGDWISITRKFYDSQTRKENVNMDNQTKEQNENIADTKLLSDQKESAQPLLTVEAEKKPGRPKSTNRTAKFTLYMTDELMKKINLLADLDETTSTDLMNHVLEDYCDNSRADDMNFLYELERRKQERRQKAGNQK